MIKSNVWISEVLKAKYLSFTACVETLLLLLFIWMIKHSILFCHFFKI